MPDVSRPGIRKCWLLLITALLAVCFSFPLQHCPRQMAPRLQKRQYSEEVILGWWKFPAGFWWQILVKIVTRVEGDIFSWFGNLSLTSVEEKEYWGASHPAGPPVSTCCWVGVSLWPPTSSPPAGPRTSCWGSSEGGTGVGGPGESLRYSRTIVGCG